MIKRIIAWWRNRRLFVIMDARDNSVTLSRHLFNHIRSEVKETDTRPKAFVFFTPAAERYGFAINIAIDRPTQMADIQYNTRHRCVGFETLNPTVAKILYDYGLPHTTQPYKLSVTAQQTPQGHTYFQIEKPHTPPLQHQQPQ